MRKVCMCDHCSFIGTEDQVSKHEKTCKYNPEVKCCQNCIHYYQRHQMISTLVAYADKFGNPIPNPNPGPFYDEVCTYNSYPETDGSLRLTFVSRPLQDANTCEQYKRNTNNS